MNNNRTPPSHTPEPNAPPTTPQRTTPNTPPRHPVAAAETHFNLKALIRALLIAHDMHPTILSPSHTQNQLPREQGREREQTYNAACNFLTTLYRSAETATTERLLLLAEFVQAVGASLALLLGEYREANAVELQGEVADLLAVIGGGCAWEQEEQEEEEVEA